MNRSFLKIMIVVVGLQSMVIMPSDDMAYFDNDAQEQEVHGIPVDLEHDESLFSEIPPDADDRTIEIAVTTPELNFKMITDSWIMQGVISVLLLVAAYKWYNNDSVK